MGLESRWHEVAQAYSDANRMFGDIIKVTPSSKVVGDMALMMVSQEFTVADIEAGEREIAFPGFGDFDDDGRSWPTGRWLGRPHYKKRILKDRKPVTERPGALLADIDLNSERARAIGRDRPRALRPATSLLPDVPRKCFATTRDWRKISARSRCCRPRSISMASDPARKCWLIWNGARPW